MGAVINGACEEALIGATSPEGAATSQVVTMPTDSRSDATAMYVLGAAPPSPFCHNSKRPVAHGVSPLEVSSSPSLPENVPRGGRRNRGSFRRGDGDLSLSQGDVVDTCGGGGDGDNDKARRLDFGCRVVMAGARLPRRQPSSAQVAWPSCGGAT